MVLDGDRWGALQLMRELEGAVPDSAEFESVLSTFSKRRRVITEPPGARVYRRPHADPVGDWEEVGLTPTDGLIFANFVATQLRIDLDGYHTIEGIFGWGTGTNDMVLPLDPIGTIPDGMVRVPGGIVEIGRSPCAGCATLPNEAQRVRLPSFLLGRFEVTNREYKEFVDAGGYEDEELWERPFVRDGQTITSESAMALMVDRTGRTGPDTWVAGNYPVGQDEHPVTGVSWYEASAYARFRGMELPTLHHWNLAKNQNSYPYTVPFANFESSAPEPVGAPARLGRSGLYDMYGNVREWCLNEEGGLRHAMGGGFSDFEYLGARPYYPQDPFDRSEINGIRLALYPVEDDFVVLAQLPIEPVPVPDYRAIPRITDDEFAFIKSMYAYDPADLQARVELTDSAQTWIREWVTYDAAYGGERVKTLIYLPRNATPPYQVIIYFPGTGAQTTNSIDNVGSSIFRDLTGSGRVVVFPMYQGTYERRLEDLPPIAATVAYREYLIQLNQDLRRTVDYLLSRGDMDADRIGYYGVSWGGAVASVMLALETRVKAAVLNVAGIDNRPKLVEAHEMTFLPFVAQPVLMLTGRYDATFLFESQSQPFFELLGSHPDLEGTAIKDQVISDRGHAIPRVETTKHLLEWFDTYLGRVR